MSELKDKNLFPAIALRGLVAFPRMVMHFDISREMSVNAIEKALEGDRKIFLVTQKSTFIDKPNFDELYKTGIVAEIKQVLKMPDGKLMRVIVEGLYKAKLTGMNYEENRLNVEIKRMVNYSRVKYDKIEVEAVMRSVKEAFERYAELLPKMPDEVMENILSQEDPIAIFESIAFNVNIDYHDKQILLEEPAILPKLTLLCTMLNQETEILKLEKEIHEHVYENLDRNQKEYYLREQLNVIKSELGDDDDSEIEEYKRKIQAVHFDEKTEEILMKEVSKLEKSNSSSQESYVIKNYLDTVLSLPWNKKSSKKISFEKSREILDKKHYGLEKVKERIMESIAVNTLVPDIKGQIICLVGPPGVGKTSIGRSIAKALGRKYVRISLGGVRDESEIRGHRKTYVGAMPGRIINALKQAGSNNPLILLDEIDKMSNDFKGDPSSALLEVLDSEQNRNFTDHFIEIPFDLSKAVFVTTANTTETIPEPLLDRMEVIELSSYNREEKFNIAKKHLIAKNLKKNGLKAAQMKIDDETIYTIIDGYTKEAGVRNLSREIDKLCRKTAAEIVSGKSKRISFTNKNIEQYLGVKKYLPDEQSGKNQIGVVNGLAWTSVGGVMMPLEVLVLKGKGNIEITGSLGDVMKESAKLAVSYARSIADKYGIDENFYTDNDLHIHAVEGAVPKDGPSAGVTMATAIVSALSGIPVRGDVAMTGEITLHGKVLAIGGLKEKTMAAYKTGMKTVIVPAANKADISEIDDIVKKNLTFIYAETLDDVLENALLKTENEESVTV